MRSIWLTDTHFYRIAQKKLISFFLELESKKVDNIFITGDVSNGKHLVHHLKTLEKIVKIPIYFVTGNHDIHYSSFKETENLMNNLMQENSNLVYLNSLDPISLTEKVALVGDTCWCDAAYEEPSTPFVFILDWWLIREFRSLFDMKEVLEFIRKKASQSAERIVKLLHQALETHSEVYLLVHFPPWPEKGGKGITKFLEKFWLGYNSSKVVADAIENTMKNYPDKKLIVYSGHTHRRREEIIAPNIFLRVGGAVRGITEIQDIIEIE